MKICATCETEYPDSELFCPRDGTALRSRDPNAELVGTVIAERYLVMRKLGEGGMGQVYLAEHVRMRRKSAVKIMHPGMVNDSDALSRFHREAANACQIQHPNVASIYDFGESSDGIVYLAMEYIEGQSLARLLAAERVLAPARAADIARQIAAGLDVAHRLGIVHRDLKPDNVLVGAHHDGRDNIKLVDFGISKAAGTEGQSVTRTGQVVGTPDYMSPEQLTGENVDFRSDIYSLAIVVFTMLTGALPFPSDNVHTAMLARLTALPRRLSETRPNVAWPAELQSVLDRAMELDAPRRHPSASTFAAALVDAAALVPNAAAALDARDARTVLADVPVVPPAPVVTPVNPSFPVASGMTAAELSVVEARLASAVGPIARVLVRRAAAAAPSRDSLISSLAGEIDDERERERFRKSVS